MLTDRFDKRYPQTEDQNASTAPEHRGTAPRRSRITAGPHRRPIVAAASVGGGAAPARRRASTLAEAPVARAMLVPVEHPLDAARLPQVPGKGSFPLFFYRSVRLHVTHLVSLAQ